MLILPWVPEVSRGPLRDLPAEGRLTSGQAARKRVTIETLTETGNRARQTSGTQGTLILERKRDSTDNNIQKHAEK